MRIRRLLAALVLMAGVLLGISACDNRPCESGHYEYVPTMIGKTMTVLPVWDCDVYGKANPNGQ